MRVFAVFRDEQTGDSCTKQRYADPESPGGGALFIGFTLIELIVVCAILAVLAGLLFPALNRARASADTATCKGRLHQIGLALKMYVDDDRGKYPFYLGPPGPSYGDAVATGGKPIGMVYWSSKLYPYRSLNWSNTAYHCPSYKGVNWGPYERGNAERVGSYGYNACGATTSSHLGLGSLLFWTDAATVAESQIMVPSEMFAIGDSKFKRGGEIPGGSDFLTLFDNDFAPVRHGKNYNQLCCDGHVLEASPWVLFNSNSAAMWNSDHQPHPEFWPRIK